MVHKDELEAPAGAVGLAANAGEVEVTGEVTDMVDLRRSLQEQQAEIEAIRQELIRQRDALDDERLRAADRIARDAEDIERQRAELAAEQAVIEAERQTLAANLTAAAEDAEQESDPATHVEAELSVVAEVVEEQPRDVEPEAAPEPLRQRGDATAHEDPTIEEYMANLLKRMRGGVTSEAAPKDARAARKPQPAPEPAAPAAAPSIHAPVMATIPAMVERTPAQAEQARRTQTIETRDLAKMRELANTQARIAIDLHGRKRLVKNLCGALAISVFFLCATFITLNVLPGHPALETGALAGVVAAIYWLFRGANLAEKLKNEPVSRKAAIRKQIEAAQTAEEPRG